MSKRFSILTDAYVFSEYYEESPSFSVLFLNLEEIKRIKKTIGMLKRNKLRIAICDNMGDSAFYSNPVAGCDYHMTEQVPHDNLMEFSNEVCNDQDFLRTTGSDLYIRNDGKIFFVDHLKHSEPEVKVESGAVDIKELEELIAMTAQEAPRYLGKSQMFRARAQKLLEEGS